MARAVCGGLPGMAAVVVHFKDDGIGMIAQPHLAAAVVQRTRPGAEHATYRIRGLHIRRHRRDDEPRARADGRAGGEVVADFTRDAAVGEVLGPRLRII